MNTTVNQDRLKEIESINLRSGTGSALDEQLCVMQAVDYVSSGGLSDHPECACPVLTSFLIKLNDSVRFAEFRQELKPYITRVVGTRDGNSNKRRDILVHMAVAQVTPHALRLTGIASLEQHAKACEGTVLGDNEGQHKAANAAAYSADAAYSSYAYAAYAAAAAAYSAANAATSATSASAADAASSASSAANASYYDSDKRVYWEMCLRALDKCLELK